MQELALRFDCVMTRGGRLSPYKGSMLRGAIGAALRKTCCVTHKQECKGCLIESVCPFPKLFLAQQGNTTALPVPFCLQPSLERDTEYTEGRAFSYSLLLFSHAIDYAPFFVHAVVLAGETGIGKRVEHTMASYAVKDIHSEGKSVWNAETKSLLPLSPQRFDFPVWNPENNREAVLKVRFETPCRFKQENRLSEKVSFLEFILLILRRLRSLALFDKFDYSIEDFSSFCDTANAVETIASDLHWTDWSRWSNHQGKNMQLGGITGTISYRGKLTSFLPFIQAGQKVQIGKQTSFGLGIYSFELA